MSDHPIWIHRCFDLALRGLGRVSPNPPVGAVLVHNDRIMAEGYHTHFGGPHAEVMAIQNVPDDRRHLIPDATLYVSLEPCCVTGKTPPCTDLIIREGIKKVVVSVIDPNPQVAGKGISTLEKHGIEVITGICQDEGNDLIRSFRTNIFYHRPHVILKWAQSKYNIAGQEGKQIWLSHPSTASFTHRLRAHHDCLMVGARTVETDDPALTTRQYPGRSPARAVYDPSGKLHSDHKVFQQDGCQIFYFSQKDNQHILETHIQKARIDLGPAGLDQMMSTLLMHQIGNVVVEGGSYLQKQLIDHNLWDEAWVIRTAHDLAEGIIAPNVKGRLMAKWNSASDEVIGIANAELKMV